MDDPLTDIVANSTLDKIAEAKSFLELERIFRTWIDEGTIESRKKFLPIGYISLIAHPNVILPDGVEGIKAAEECQRIMTRYSQETINIMLAAEDEKNKMAASFLIIPPQKALLLQCKSFYQLDKLISIDTKDLPDEEIAKLEGDEYAKVWITLANKGLSEEDDLDKIPSQMGGTAFVIRKMKLSEEVRGLLNDEHMEDYTNNFFKGGKTSGCFTMVVLLVITSAFAFFL